jgi:hypothetical protein
MIEIASGSIAISVSPLRSKSSELLARVVDGTVIGIVEIAIPQARGWRNRE